MRAVLLAAALAWLAGCRTVAPTPQRALDELAATAGGYLAGPPSGLGPARVLNAEDFVYDARPSPDGKTVAVARLGGKGFFLALHAVDTTPPVKRADVAMTPVEWDVDALDFSPDGQVVAAVSRDGVVRFFSAKDGAPLAQWLTEEPLVSVAWAPGGALLAVGSAKGLVTVLAWPALAFLGEARAHRDEVRGLAWTASLSPIGGEGQGEGQNPLHLLSGGWDRRLVTHRVAEPSTPPRSARLAFTKKSATPLFRVSLDGRALGQVTYDTRTPGVVVVRGALAQAAGIDVAGLTDTVSLDTGLGTQLARVAKGRRLVFKTLVLDGVDVAVCDACVPPDAQGVLGPGFLERVDVAFDEVAGEVVLTAKEGAAVGVAPSRELLPVREVSFPAAINDMSIDAAGRTLGVAFSETKAERTRAVYEREKRKDVEPERAWDVGARVDAATGQVLETLRGHRGVVATAGISPDGKTLATGGWDKTVRLHLPAPQPAWVDDDYGWAVRRVRFSRDGRWLVTAAWTPLNPVGDHSSDPAAAVYEVLYAAPSVAR